MNTENLKRSINIIGDYIFALLIIFSCGSIYDNFTNINLYISEIFMVILLIKVNMIAVKQIKLNEKRKIKKIITFSIIYVAYQLIYIVFHLTRHNINSNIIVYVAKLIVIFLLLIYYYWLKDNNNEFNGILNRITNIVLIICIVSLFFYLFGSVLNFIKNTNVVDLTFGFTRKIKSYFMVYFEPQYTIVFNKYVIRNCGIFAEAPMFSIVLLITLVYETLIKKEKKNYRLLILFITILTTMSTIGIAVAILILIIDIVKRLLEKYKNINRRKVLIISIIVIIIGLIIGSVAIIDKLRSPSFIIRMDDYIASFKAWIDSPILGNGYQNYQAVEQYVTVNREAGGQSSSLTNLLVEGGIWIFVIYAIPFIILLKEYIQKRDINKIIFILMLLIIFSTIIFTYSLMVLLFISYGWYKVIFKGERIENEDIYSNS